jgi:UDP-glucose 4-epimerase
VRVLVTGGLGFLGRPVTADLLAAGHEVTVLTRGRPGVAPPTGADVVDGDVRDRQRLHEVAAHGRFEAVCHLAGLISGRDSFADPLSYFDVNVGGTLNLLTALDAVRAGRPPVRFVLVSTNIVYGSVHRGPLGEELAPHPESPYAESKLAAERLVAAYAATGVIGAVVLRPFNIAGAVGGVPDTDPGRILPNALRAATGQAPHVTLNGDGSAVRDFVHVADAADAVRLALAAATPGASPVYNVGSGVGSSMADVIRAVEEVAGRPVPVRRAAPRPEPPALVGDVRRAAAELGWRPARSQLRRIVADAWSAWPRPA